MSSLSPSELLWPLHDQSGTYSWRMHMDVPPLIWCLKYGYSCVCSLLAIYEPYGPIHGSVDPSVFRFELSRTPPRNNACNADIELWIIGICRCNRHSLYYHDLIHKGICPVSEMLLMILGSGCTVFESACIVIITPGLAIFFSVCLNELCILRCVFLDADAFSHDLVPYFIQYHTILSHLW